MREAAVADQGEQFLEIFSCLTRVADDERGAEREAGQLLQEMVEQRLFQIGLVVFRPLGQPGEFQDVRVPNEVFDGLGWFLAVSAGDDGLSS